MRCILPLFLILSSCDYVSIASITNQRSEKISVVISPYHHSESSIIANNQWELITWDTLNQKGYFDLAAGKSAPIAEGLNGFSPRNLQFNHIEIRTSSDTLILDGREEIHGQFVETEDHFYTWAID
jgi:hypothetical protein